MKNKLFLSIQRKTMGSKTTLVPTDFYCGGWQEGEYRVLKVQFWVNCPFSFLYKKFKFMQYCVISCKWTPLYCSILNHVESQIIQNNKEWITVVLARNSQCGKYHNDNALGPQAFRVVDVIPHIMPISLLVMACVHTTK